MRLEQFIIEGSRHTKIEFEDDFIEDKVYQMAKLLFKNCKEYLKDLNIKSAGRVMYRGAYGDDMTKIVPRKDRQPKDMDWEQSEALDDEFKRKFGWKPRSEGVFCSGDIQQAKGYGDGVFTVWPMGKYKLLWSWSIFDLYTKLDGMDSEDYIDSDVFYQEWEDTYGEDSDGGSWYYDGDDTETSDQDDAEEIVLGWIQDNFDQLVKDNPEYYKDKGENFDPEDDFDSYAWEWMPDMDADTFVQDRITDARENIEDDKLEVVLDYKDKDINAALRSNNEIMIGCKSYYIIDDDYTNELIKILTKGAIQPVHKQLKFQFAYKKRRPNRRK